MGKRKSDELEQFAKQFIHCVRDRSISACDKLARGEIGGPDGKRWKNLISNEHCDVFRELIPDIVDQTLFQFLNAVDNEEISIAWRTLDGEFLTFDDLGMGEMAGWLMGSPGWRNNFSAKRFFDPLADIRLDFGQPGLSEEEKE